MFITQRRSQRKGRAWYKPPPPIIIIIIIIYIVISPISYINIR